MILVACCPPGNVSNILTHRARGDVALSVSMTAVANNWALFVAYIGVVAVAVFSHDALALGLGYAIARGFRLDVPARKAMTFEVGIRNAGLGLLFVFSFFGGLGGMALVAAWWGVWDIIAGLIVAVLWARRTRATEAGAGASGSRATTGETV